MTVTTVKQALAMEAGLPIIAFAGVIGSVMDQQSGDNANGPWVCQNIFLKEAEAKIKVSIWNKDAVPKTAVGKKVYFNSVNGQHGWNGVKTKENVHNGKTSLVVNVTATAEMGFGDLQQPAPAPQPYAPEPPEHEPPQAQAQPVPVATPAEIAAIKKAVAMEAVKSARIDLAKAHNAYLLAMHAGKSVREKFRLAGENMENGQFQAMISFFVIRMDRRGYINDLPTGDIEEYIQKKKIFTTEPEQ